VVAGGENAMVPRELDRKKANVDRRHRKHRGERSNAGAECHVVGVLGAGGVRVFGSQGLAVMLGTERSSLLCRVGFLSKLAVGQQRGRPRFLGGFGFLGRRRAWRGAAVVPRPHFVPNVVQSSGYGAVK
jgi:hypothetical protein